MPIVVDDGLWSSFMATLGIYGCSIIMRGQIQNVSVENVPPLGTTLGLIMRYKGGRRDALKVFRFCGSVVCS